MLLLQVGRRVWVLSNALLLLQVGDTFYILSGGKVRVTRGDTVIRELDTGDYFGEQVRGWCIVGGLL